MSGSSSVGRTFPCQGKGRRFEPGLPLILSLKLYARVAELVDLPAGRQALRTIKNKHEILLCLYLSQFKKKI